MMKPDRPESPKPGSADDVIQGNAPNERTRSIIQAWRDAGATFDDLAAELGVSKGLLHKVLNKPGYWSDRLIEMVLHERWHSLTVRFRLPDDDALPALSHLPRVVIADIPLRQCPVTDRWFIPSTPHQRYAPGLSEAVRRAARRDLEQARARYRREGDWANHE